MMNLNDFVTRFADEFEETPREEFTPKTVFKNLDEWSSLSALSIISMIDEEFAKRLTGADMRQANTIEDLYRLVTGE
jgi:acyl carrier protein